MIRPVELLRGVLSAARARYAAIADQSERSLLIGAVLLLSAVSAVTGFILVQYYSVDVLSSLIHPPYDCMADWGMNFGRHCFSDYTMPVTSAMRSNPWDPYPLYMPPDFKPLHNNYPAAAMVPLTIFGVIGKGLGAPQLGLFGYLFFLTIAVLSPAIWAARGARGLERIVVFAVCGMVAIPAWMAIDRGNSVGLVVPVALVFLVALCRQRWGTVAVMVVLAALVKPQFAVLAVALFAARQWRLGAVTLVSAVICNIAAYVLWPKNFPETILQSIHNTLGYGTSRMSVSDANVSFSKAILAVPDGIKAGGNGGLVPDDFLAAPRSMIGYAVLALVVFSILVLGRRIPPVMAGIALLATASLFPAVSNRYYFVFALPIAALVLRDPDGPPGTGIFDRFAVVGGHRRTVGVCVSLASALTIAQIALPSSPVRVQVLGPTGELWTVATLVVTTVLIASMAWLFTCGAIIVSYARRSAAPAGRDEDLSPEDPPSSAVTSTAVDPAEGLLRKRSEQQITSCSTPVDAMSVPRT